MIDLDLESQKAAQSIARNCTESRDILETVATKTLGVLQENGVYAAVLYTFTRADKHKKAADAVRAGLLAMAPQLGLAAAPTHGRPADVLAHVTETVCKNLDRMLLVKQVWEQALIYTRFGAKAEKQS